MADEPQDQNHRDDAVGVVHDNVETAAEAAQAEAESAPIDHLGVVMHSAPEGYANGFGEVFVPGDEPGEAAPTRLLEGTEEGDEPAAERTSDTENHDPDVDVTQHAPETAHTGGDQ